MALNNEQTHVSENETGTQKTNSALRLGRLSIDYSHVDCAFIAHQFPGGCLLETNHKSDVTHFFVHELEHFVLIAFSETLDNHTVFRPDDLAQFSRFLALREKVVLLIPELVYADVSAGIAAAVSDD